MSDEAPIDANTIALPTTVVNPTSVAINAISDKAQVLQELMQDIPQNHLGLPEYVYRADIIPGDLNSNREVYDGETRTELLDQAIMELDYSQGYPTQMNTEPFWGKLPYEPIEAYNAFVAYMDLPREDGTRHVSHDLAEHPLKNFTGNVPVRQLHLLKTMMPQVADNLLNFYHMYCWPYRTRAYDLFHAAHHNKMKQHRMQSIENKHFDMATQFLNYAENFLHQVFQNPDEYELRPKEAMDLMVKMIQVQRISAGATPFGSSQKDTNALPANASMEVILRTIAQQAGIDVTKKDGVDPSKMLMSDPEALQQAQELIIRMNGMATGGDRSINPDFETNTNTGV